MEGDSRVFRTQVHRRTLEADLLDPGKPSGGAALASALRATSAGTLIQNHPAELVPGP